MGSPTIQFLLSTQSFKILFDSNVQKDYQNFSCPPASTVAPAAASSSRAHSIDSKHLQWTFARRPPGLPARN